MNLSDELRNELLEAAAWGKAGINITETREVQAEEQETLEEGKTKASRTEQPVIEEEEAVHVCPLCISQLDEAIDEESLLEHLDVVMGLVDRLSQINEGEEDVDSVIEEALADLLLGDTEEEDDLEEQRDPTDPTSAEWGDEQGIADQKPTTPKPVGRSKGRSGRKSRKSSR